MTTLEDVLNAPHDYDNDLNVTFSYDKDGHIDGFQYANYNSNTGYTWGKKENSHLATPQINRILKEWGYRPIIKQDGFNTCWDYRLITPNWSTFRLWLYVFYANKEVDGERTDAERDECMKIREHVGNLSTPYPALYEMRTWAEEQTDWHLLGSHREVKYLYRDLKEILDNYAGWAGTLKVNG